MKYEVGDLVLIPKDVTEEYEYHAFTEGDPYEVTEIYTANNGIMYLYVNDDSGDNWELGFDEVNPYEKTARQKIEAMLLA
jgi:hypothetical protein